MTKPPSGQNPVQSLGWGKQDTPRVTIVLLNYRGINHTMACLDSLQALDYPNFRTLVVDNNSGDDSIKRLKARLQRLPWEFKLIESQHNDGYSAGNNLALIALGFTGLHAPPPSRVLPPVPSAETSQTDVIPPLLPDGVTAAHELTPPVSGTFSSIAQISQPTAPETPTFVWLLNNDTIVDPGALMPLVRQAQRTGGIVGSRLLNLDGSYQQAGTHLNWWSGAVRGYPEKALKSGMTVDTVSGASMLIPAKVLQTIGLLDPSYFLYFEDGEFCLRAKRAGFSSTVAIDSKIMHREGASTGKYSLNTQYYYHRNRLYMLRQFASPDQFRTIEAYTRFRYYRAAFKARLDKSPEKQKELLVFRTALEDFQKGIKGSCRHSWQ